MNMDNLYNDFIFVVSSDDPVQDPIEQEILSLAELQQGWNYGDGLPPSPETIKRAIDIYHMAKQYNLLTEVFPVGDGEILLSFSFGEVFVDILIRPNNTYRLSIEIGVGNEYETGDVIDNVSINTIEDKFKEITGFNEWNLSELYEKTTLAEENNDSCDNVSRIITALFPWWIVNASPELEIIPFVNT